MKKLLLTTLLTLSIITPSVHAGERMAKDDVERVEIHKECFMYTVLLEKEPNRYQRLELTHPQLYNYCMDKLGFKEVCKYMDIPYKN